MGLVPYSAGSREFPSHFCRVETQGGGGGFEPGRAEGVALTRRQVCGCFDLGLPSPQSCEQHISLLKSYPVYGILQQP